MHQFFSISNFLESKQAAVQDTYLGGARPYQCCRSQVIHHKRISEEFSWGQAAVFLRRFARKRSTEVGCLGGHLASIELEECKEVIRGWILAVITIEMKVRLLTVQTVLHPFCPCMSKRKNPFNPSGARLRCCRFLKLLQQNRSRLPAVDVSKIKEVTPLPACEADTPPVLVLGGASDFTVDEEGFRETADHYGVQPVILEGLAHDLMLVRSHLELHKTKPCLIFLLLPF